MLLLISIVRTESFVIQDLPPNGHLSVNGVELYYRVVGQGTPLVILHGGPGLSHGYQYPQLKQLLADDHKLIFYDQRASGWSSGVSDTAHLTMETFVEDLEAIRRAFGLEKLNLAGHSFGGLLAMYYSVEYPTHLTSLILIDSEPASLALRVPHQHKMIDSRLSDKDRRELAQIEASEPYKNGDPDAVASHLSVLTRTYFHNRALADRLPLGFDALKNFDLTNRCMREDLGQYDIHEQLSAIKCPTLIIQGDSSVLSVKGAETIHQHIVGSRLVVLENCGHFVYIERPHEFAGAVREFLSRL